MRQKTAPLVEHTIDASELSSPLKRLHAFLVTFKKVPHHVTGSDLIAEWTGVPPGPIPVLQAWVAVLQTAEHAASEVGQLEPAYTRPCLSSIKRVVEALTPFNVFTSVNQVQHNVQDSDVDLIEVAGNLAAHLPYPKISSVEIAGYLEEFHAIQEEVSAAEEIAAEVKELAERIIVDIRTAFQNYRASGPEGVSDALAKAYGLWMLNAQVVGPLKGQPAGSPILKLWEKIGKVAEAVSTVETFHKVGEQFAEILENLVH